jgi:hypothetical protein
MAWRRRRQPAFRAVRNPDGSWDLHAGTAVVPGFAGYRDAVREAESRDRRRRKTRAVAIRLALVAASLLLLVPVVVLREKANPEYQPARAFADRMEEAYRRVDAGIAEATGFTVDEHGFTGAIMASIRGGVEAEYRLLIGAHRGDCYLIRWVRFEVPFVARLLPRYECEPGPSAMSFAPSGFEAIAVNLYSGQPLVWGAVLPSPVVLRTWFFPAALILLGIAVWVLVGISLVALRGVPIMKVPVERVEPAG